MKRTAKSERSKQDSENDGKASYQDGEQLGSIETAIRDDLRLLAHRILEDQEWERCDISKWLSDDLGQMLLGIGVRLAALQQQAKLAETRIIDDIGGAKQRAAQSAQTAFRIANRKRR